MRSPLPSYGKLSDLAQAEAKRIKSRRRTAIAIALSAVVLVAAIISITVGITVGSKKSSHGDNGWKKSSRQIDLACSQTLYPELCVSTLVSYPGAMEAKTKDLAHITVNVTMNRVQKTYGFALNMINQAMEYKERMAFEDCLELLEDTMEQINVSLANIGRLSEKSLKWQLGNVQTWLSAALTNQDTCLDGFHRLKGGTIKDQMEGRSQNLSELVSNSLAMFKLISGAKDNSDAKKSDTNEFKVPPVHNRRLFSDPGNDFDREFYSHYGFKDNDFPTWFSAGDRRLLQMPNPALQADVIVAKDGTGKYKTITEAVEAAPEKSSKRYVIYVKAGLYSENIKVSKKMTNLMFIGDGKGKTVVAAGRNVRHGFTTFRSTTFATSGKGFIARDMTFENTAGPANHQAVALRVGADFSVVYRCSFIGYQDTLYVHSLRQFYRECDIYGTVDFIFGNAAVVLQNCNIFARRPMPTQKNTITAQNRKDPNQNTGISIHNCKVGAAADLVPVKSSFPTYLGRPWKMYSRTVYMQTFLDDLIHPRGWLEWSGDFALKTLYYGEYMNYGPGSKLGGRVKWLGYRIITTEDEANKFTVSQFISGSTWLPSTGIAFVAGLLYD
eukprot:Gb_21388 [translate_table: standard]